jgi:hypothetical protein
VVDDSDFQAYRIAADNEVEAGQAEKRCDEQKSQWAKKEELSVDNHRSLKDSNSRRSSDGLDENFPRQCFKFLQSSRNISWWRWRRDQRNFWTWTFVITFQSLKTLTPTIEVLQFSVLILAEFDEGFFKKFGFCLTEDVCWGVFGYNDSVPKKANLMIECRLAECWVV